MKDEHNIAILFESTMKRSRIQGKLQNSKHQAIINSNLSILEVIIIILFRNIVIK